MIELNLAAKVLALLVLAAAAASCDTSYGCSTNAECLSALGDMHICKRAPGASIGTCAALLSDDCKTVFGEWQNDDAFLFGSVLPTTGQDTSTGLACEDAIKLAVEDFKQFGPGLPAVPGVDSARRRPLAFVGCSDNSDKLTGSKAARHLVEDVGVQAIIGPQWSGVTGQVASDVTIPHNVLLISPSATARSITDLPDHGLVWRTSPSDTFQAAAIVQYVALLEPKIRASRNLMPADKIRVALIYQGTTYGLGLYDSLAQSLRMNGTLAFDDANKPYFMTNNYGDPSDPSLPLTAEAAVTATLGHNPHLVIDLCTNEGVTQILKPVEDRWATDHTGTPGPLWVLGDGGKIPELWAYIAGNDNLRKRTTGTVPGSISTLFTNFERKYDAKGFGDGTSPAVLGPAGSYDSVYLLAYSAVSLGAQPLTGPNLAAGMAALVPGAQAQKVDVGANNIRSSFNTLSAGGKIDFDGASGPLDFDTQIGEAPSDIQIWCMPKDGASQKAAAAQNSGLYLDASSMTMAGAIDPTCGL